jgi:hypothetical protein
MSRPRFEPVTSRIQVYCVTTTPTSLDIVHYRAGLGTLLVDLASTLILYSESRGTHDHILLPQDSSR